MSQNNIIQKATEVRNCIKDRDGTKDYAQVMLSQGTKWLIHWVRPTQQANNVSMNVSSLCSQKLSWTSLLSLKQPSSPRTQRTQNILRHIWVTPFHSCCAEKKESLQPDLPCSRVLAALVSEGLSSNFPVTFHIFCSDPQLPSRRIEIQPQT